MCQLKIGNHTLRRQRRHFARRQSQCNASLQHFRLRAAEVAHIGERSKAPQLQRQLVVQRGGIFSRPGRTERCIRQAPLKANWQRRLCAFGKRGRQMQGQALQRAAHQHFRHTTAQGQRHRVRGAATGISRQLSQKPQFLRPLQPFGRCCALGAQLQRALGWRCLCRQ